MISGVPEHVDGRMLAIAEKAGARLVNRDRMWHYTEGVQQLGPDLGAARHPDPARARRRCGSTPAGAGSPRPNFPGFDTLGTLAAHHARPATTTRGSC